VIPPSGWRWPGATSVPRADQFISEDLNPEEMNVVFRMRPLRWLTADFGKPA
jgi:hypothetical protein